MLDPALIAGSPAGGLRNCTTKTRLLGRERWERGMAASAAARDGRTCAWHSVQGEDTLGLPFMTMAPAFKLEAAGRSKCSNGCSNFPSLFRRRHSRRPGARAPPPSTPTRAVTRLGCSTCPDCGTPRKAKDDHRRSFHPLFGPCQLASLCLLHSCCRRRLPAS